MRYPTTIKPESLTYTLQGEKTFRKIILILKVTFHRPAAMQPVPFARSRVRQTKPCSNTCPINVYTPRVSSTLSYNTVSRVTQNTEASKNGTLEQSSPCFSLEEYPCLVVLCHTCTSLKLLSKFLIYGNILLNVSAALILTRGTPTSLQLQRGALGWVFVVLVFSLHTGRKKEQHPIWSNTFLSEGKQQDSSLTQPHTATAPSAL